MHILTAVAVLLVTVAAGCRADTGDALRVFAASSLTDVLTRIAEEFEAQRGVEVEASFAGSQTLVTQLGEGARADVLATADELSMRDAREQGLVEDVTVFATNSIALIVPSANPGAITRPADVARPGVRLVVAAPAVPAGRYGRLAFEQLGIDASRNVVSEEDDVKGVVGKVVSGEADAGVVYATDAVDGVRVIPLDVDIEAQYPVAVTSSASRAADAAAFVEFLRSAAGTEILRSAGFGVP